MAFKEWVISTPNKGHFMKVNEISVTYRDATKDKSSSYNLTINGILTEELRKKGIQYNGDFAERHHQRNCIGNTQGQRNALEVVRLRQQRERQLYTCEQGFVRQAVFRVQT